MRWTRGYRSKNVEDRRAQGDTGRGLGSGGGGGGLQLPLMLFQRFGWPGLIVGAAVLYFSGGLSDVIGSGSSNGASSSSGGANTASLEAEQPLVEFVSFVLDDVQQMWSERLGTRYQTARMVVFRGGTPSGCGYGESAMGPFYCPADSRVYIDLSFYEELRRRFGAPGDFAQAYVIAHEVGHHVQHLLGATDRVHRAPKSEQVGDQGLSVRLELQADCYAGVWAHSSQQRELLEGGDIEEALQAAASIGDDRMQEQSGGRVRPESWTHGSSAQRQKWFKSGFVSGNVEACDTFARNAL